MDLGLAGAKALVTGGSRGIGRAIAFQLGREGAAVAICARGQETLDTTVGELRAEGIDSHGFVLDIGDPEAIAGVVDRAAETLGGLDVVVSNVSAGASPERDQWEKSFNADLLGFVRLVEASVPHLERSDRASITAIASTSGVDTLLPARPNSYAAFKAAVIQHASSLGHALPAKGIRVNTVTPGPIYFEGGPWARLKEANPEFVAEVTSRIRMGRMGSPEDVARAVAFLASPAAGYLTATNLVVDGGFTSRIQF